MFEWISNGGCARCDAMEGFYLEEPVRPHPNCQCQIINHQSLTDHLIVGEVHDVEWNERRHWRQEEDGQPWWYWEGFFTVRGEIRVRCQDGTELLETLERDYDYEISSDAPSFFLDDLGAHDGGWADPWYEDAMQRGREMAEEECPDFLCC